MAIYLVGYALLRWQFGSWVPICQSNTLVPRQVLHRSEDKDLISPAYFLEFQSIFPRIHIWYFQNSFLQVLSRARSRSWLFCLLTDWWYKRWWENHVNTLSSPMSSFLDALGILRTALQNNGLSDFNFFKVSFKTFLKPVSLVSLSVSNF